MEHLLYAYGYGLPALCVLTVVMILLAMVAKLFKRHGAYEALATGSALMSFLVVAPVMTMRLVWFTDHVSGTSLGGAYVQEVTWFFYQHYMETYFQ